jgi:nicotinamidase-related amidase
MDTPPLIPAADQTALVLVDLQNFTVNHAFKPLSGREVLANAVRLADACRAAGILVVLIRAEGGAPLNPPRDFGWPDMQFPENGHEIPAELGPKPGDIVVRKYQLGAFYCTELDAHLRRRGINTIILGGLASAFGLEATARQAHERAYHQVIVSDAMSGFWQEEHDNALTYVLPRLGRVRPTDAVIAALSGQR